MRLIDADAAIKNISDVLDATENILQLPTGMTKTIVTGCLKTEPTVDTDINVLGKWISVDDETPEATEEDMEGDLTLSRFVLVFLKYKSGFTFITVDKYRPDMDAWMSEVPGEGCKVTHWMELPAPPEAGT